MHDFPESRAPAGIHLWARPEQGISRMEELLFEKR